MQMNRLFEIVYLLLDKKNMTAKELALHFEVSTRTIYRDIEALVFAGIPIYSERGKNGGVRLLENYVLNKGIILEKEQNEILYALKSLKAVNYSNTEAILLKLRSIFNKPAEDWIEIDFSSYGEIRNTLFENIKEALINKKIVKFYYYNSKSEKSLRKVEPLKIWFKERAWYLFAYCHEKKDIRQFKMTRIRDLVLTEEHFERALEKIDISDKSNTPERIKILVEIDKSQAYRVYDEFCEKNIRSKPDGNFEVVMENYENEWLYGYMLSYGEYLTVLEPERIRNILYEKVNKMRENFRKEE